MIPVVLLFLAVELPERHRIASCDWRDTLLVDFFGHRLQLGDDVIIATQDDPFLLATPKTPAEPYDQPKFYCMDHADPEVVSVLKIDGQFGWGNEEKLSPLKLPEQASLIGFEFAPPGRLDGLVEPDQIPPPVAEDSVRLILHRNDEDVQTLVTRGLVDEARLSLSCEVSEHEPILVCDVSAEDQELGLSWSFSVVYLPIAPLEGQPPPEAVQQVIPQMRRILALWAA